ncbi:hypothetical protein ACWDYJ_17335 [Streptomyces sp. NPDC003042]
MTAYTSASRLRRAVLIGALCAGLVVTGTACGKEKEVDPDKGTNGVGKLPAETIEAQAKAAAAEADSVHLSGTLVSGGKTFTLDMRLKSDGGSGEVKSQEDTFQLLRVGEQLYLKASAAFWGQSDSAGKLGDKYVKVPAADPSYKQFRGFTDMDVLLDGLLGLQGKLTKGAAYTTVGATRAVQLSADAGRGGKLSVSLEGTPYPLLMERAGGAGRVELAEWGSPFPLDPPAKDQTVDYGSQLPTTKDGKAQGGAPTPTPSKSSGQGSNPTG